MKTGVIEIRARGKTIKVPSVSIYGKTVIVRGKFIKMAGIHDEEWQEGQVDDPGAFVDGLKHELNADIFTFVQKLPDTKPKYAYPMQWDNVAAIRITRFEEWWEKQLPQVTRKSVRRGAKRGVTASVTEYNDDLVKGIIGIHNDTETRQGIPFYHYGKDFPVVKREYGTFLDRSVFIGAYHEGELIGIIKFVCTGGSANIMQIVTKTRHYDKRPTNILIAKAVEVCEQKGIPFLVYGRYIYGNKTNSSLTEFKRRNGFEKIDMPRYYIPLTMKGVIALKLNLHLGLFGILPDGVINLLRSLRSKYYQVKFQLSKSNGKPQSRNPDEAESDSSME